MNVNKKFSPLLHSLLSVTLTLGVLPLPVQAQSGGGSCVKQFEKKCPSSVNAPGVVAPIGWDQENNINTGSQLLQQNSAIAAAAANQVKEQCLKAYDECKLTCRTEAQSCESLKKRADMAAAEAMQAQSTGQGAGDTGQASGSDGGGGGMDPSALMAALAPLAMLAMQKKDKKKEEDPNNQGALRPDGTLDCSKSDAWQYQNCNNHLMQACTSLPDHALCQNFTARFCNLGGGGGGGVPSGGTGGGIAISSVGAPVLGAPGEGRGTPYCQKAVASAFCNSGASPSCPTCQYLSAITSPACVQNPTLCLPQMSADQLQHAKMTCPSDPMFTDPNFANVIVGNPSAPNAPGGGSGAPAVVLPQSVDVASGGGGGMSPASAGAGTREGLPPPEVVMAQQRARASAAGAGHGGSDRLASANSVVQAPGFRPSSRGPASDIHGQYGPSLFSTSAQVMRERCQAGKLLNCP